MRIRTKLIISNFLMFLIPVLLGGFILCFAGNYIDSRYVYTWKEFFEDENAMISAKSNIYEYQKELWNTDWKELTKQEEAEEEMEPMELSNLAVDQNTLEQSGQMTMLGNSLNQMGYHFAVFMNGDCQYSNMTKTDEVTLQNLIPESLANADSLMISKNNNSIVKCSFVKEKILCEIIAINVGNQIHGMTVIEEWKSRLFQLAGVVMLFIMIVLAVVNAALSGWISRSILKPINRLEKGIQEIKVGNLCETGLDPADLKKSNNEIQELCRGFHEMSCYLSDAAHERVENEERRKEMIAGISHDLRTPLTVIKGYVEAVLYGLSDKKEMQEKYLKAVLARSSDLERLVDKLSLYNRFEQQQIMYSLKKENLQELLLEYAKKYVLEIEKGKLTLQLCVQNADMKGLIDRKEFQRVFDNIVSNSLHYGDKEICNITIKVSKKEQDICMRFEDDGPGVASEDLNRIFDSFYRTDSARSNPSKGSGLGLAIVKDIVNGHKGRVSAYIPDNKIGLGIEIRIPEEGEKKDAE